MTTSEGFAVNGAEIPSESGDDKNFSESVESRYKKVSTSLDNLLEADFVNAADLVTVRQASEEELRNVFVEKYQSADEFIAGFADLSEKLLSEQEKQETGLSSQLHLMELLKREYATPGASSKELERVSQGITRKRHPLSEVIPNLNLRATYKEVLDKDREGKQVSNARELLQRLDRLDLKISTEEEQKYKDTLKTIEGLKLEKVLAEYIDDAAGIERVMKHLASLYSAEELFNEQRYTRPEMQQRIEREQINMEKQFNTIQGLENALDSDLDIRAAFVDDMINSITRHNHIYKNTIPGLNLRRAVMTIFADKLNKKYPNVFKY
ncbi:hypothetical protein ACFL1U_01765 [Patescibacteria group bacterium]